MARTDLIGVVEAAYDLELDDREWLANLVRIVAPHLDTGRGVAACYFDASDPLHPRVWNPVDVGETTLPMKLRFGRDVIVGRDSAAANWVARGPTTVGSLTSVLRQAGLLEQMRPWIVLSGHFDYLGIRACDAAMRGVAFAACRAEPFVAPPATCRRWARVAAHIAAAYRLRRSLRIANVDPLIDDGDAVFDGDGRCHHAVSDAALPDARAELRQAAVDVDRARGRARSGDQALTAWRGLVDGTWSLVERFESDGRRFFVARRNEPGLLDPRGLSLREKQIVSFVALGHSNKLIAYELGVRNSTVTAQLTSAMHKLGVRNRMALVRLLYDLGSLGDAFARIGGDR